jgi:hypothetical protein
LSRFHTVLVKRATFCLLASATLVGSAQAQDLPTDAQLQAAFGTVYNHLGLMEYCAAKGFATATDVANMRRMVDATIAGMTVEAAARAQEDIGRRGDIVGPQFIGLLDSSNPARPELVPEGQTMSLADNARAQKSSERALCGLMAAQVEPLP